MGEIEFFQPMEIPRTTHQQKRVAVVNGKPRFYEPPKLKTARSCYMLYLRKHAPAAPMQGPVSLAVRFRYHSPRMKKGRSEWKTTRPDTDNMIKLLKDCLTALGYWHDDAQVCREHIEKTVSGDVEGILMKIAPMSAAEKGGHYGKD